MRNPGKGNAWRAPSRRDLSDCNGPGGIAAQSVILLLKRCLLAALRGDGVFFFDLRFPFCWALEMFYQWYEREIERSGKGGWDVGATSFITRIYSRLVLVSFPRPPPVSHSLPASNPTTLFDRI